MTFVITVRQVGDAVRMQRLSCRERQAVDFRKVEGAVNACGVGTVLSGLAGVLPPWPYTAGIALADGIGVAARRVGVHIGIVLVALAFVPKIGALILSIPPPVLGAYIMVIFGVTFAQGMRIVFREGANRQNALVAGLAFWIGVGIQFQAIFPGHLATPTGRMLANGLTAGGLTVLLLTLFLELTGPRRRKTENGAAPGQPPGTRPFRRRLRDPVRLGRHGDGTSARRVRGSVALSLAPGGGRARAGRGGTPPAGGRSGARATVPCWNSRRPRGPATWRTGCCCSETRPDPTSERDLSLALLRHHATSVQHREYHNVDILAVRVDR